MTAHRVVMIGSFPPPVGGAALVNQMVLDALRSRGARVSPLDVSGPALAHNRTMSYHASRVAANLGAAVRARRIAKPGDILYIVPDAGAGAWYSAGLVEATVDRFGAVVVHHHSCRYIEELSRPIAMLTRRLGNRARHVFLTAGMAAAFDGKYGPVRAHVATNARFVIDEAMMPSTPRRPGPLRLGHLSNLCADKGFFATADTFDALRAADIDVTLALAGPALEPEVTARIADLATRHGDRLHHLGPVTGSAKRDFYRGIDLFLFPTQFRQEAAPLVIYESLAAGVPVLSTDRGVIAELVAGNAGAVCARDADFPAFALEQIARMRAEGVCEHRSSAIKHKIREACAVSMRQYDELLAVLSTPSEDTAS